MGTFNLSIDTDNAAFEEDRNLEIARILREVADSFESTRWVAPASGNSRDFNGNTVSSWELR